MLKKIVFLVADAGQKGAIEKMKQGMGLHSGDILYGEPVDWEKTGLGSCIKREILFVTDSAPMLQELKRREDYAAVLLHGNNRAEDLSGAAYAVTDIEGLTWDYFEKIYQRLAGEPWFIMETDRCIIRETTVEDVDAFYRIYAEPSVTYYMEDLFSDPKDEIAYTKEYIRKIYGFYGYGLWSVVRRENREVIGRAGLSWRAGYDVPELGFLIAVPYQRQGYAYEVCCAVVRYGEEELGFGEMQALVRKENEASARLCRKLGFVRVGAVTEKDGNYERYVRR